MMDGIGQFLLTLQIIAALLLAQWPGALGMSVREQFTLPGQVEE